MIKHGPDNLSTSELLAILIGSGSREESALQLCQRILGDVGQDLNLLARKSVKEMQLFKGIGEAKAITILAALELANRRRSNGRDTPQIIKSSRDAYRLIKDKLRDKVQEEFWIILLKRSNAVITKLRVGQGGVAGVYADPKIIMKHAIEHLASAIVLVHNHPSGAIKPSAPDIALTHRIAEATKFMDISLLDHLIIGGDAYYSFADEGNLLPK